MQATVAHHTPPVVRRRPKPRLAGVQATLAALGAALLAMFGIHEY
jgi:hypothetical protein